MSGALTIICQTVTVTVSSQNL